MSTARIPPGGFKELGPVNWVLWRILSKGAGAADAHLFSTLGRTGGLFRGWLHYSGKLMPGDIFNNIVGNATFTVDDAWEAATLAGKSCVMGQIRDGGVVVTVLPVLSTGKCFVGDAR